MPVDWKTQSLLALKNTNMKHLVLPISPTDWGALTTLREAARTQRCLRTEKPTCPGESMPMRLLAILPGGVHS
jgi:hypothetical protein